MPVSKIQNSFQYPEKFGKQLGGGKQQAGPEKVENTMEYGSEGNLKKCLIIHEVNNKNRFLVN